MTLVQLEYYVQICECGTLTGAAKRLNVTRPTLSVAIKQLEDEYGNTFILRHSSGKNTVTESGKLFYAFAKSALRQIDSMNKSVKAALTEV